ncbi:MAG: hypothetical protein IJO74_05300 [Clostridia bacterium]|nr:hypothetical protein [Clostridia bacterium]
MKKIHLIFAVIVIFSAICASVVSSTYAADTSNDPLVTLSYVEEVLAPRLKDELVLYIQKNYVSSQVPDDTANQDTPTDNNQPLVPKSDVYEVVHLTKGQVLYALSPTELILRSGKANAVSAFMDQGVCDMTDGGELLNDEPLVRYHYCLIPRGDDGRGIIAVSDEIYIMVRGEYEIRE